MINYLYGKRNTYNNMYNKLIFQREKIQFDYL